jgi:DNA polymerase III subunit epsilon
MDFVAIDVETANADLSSICQVGTALFRDGSLADTWMSLVNPEDEFDPINISIHGIDGYQVRDAPTWAGIYPKIASLITNKIVLSHTAFDRVAITRACDRSNLPTYTCTWLDSAKVARRAWSEFAQSGYGLSHLSNHFGIRYRAHDAGEDARCAGELLLLAIAETGLTVEQWLVRVEQPIHPSAACRVNRDGNPEGELFGEIIVFTGALSMPRSEAADVAAAAGCRVDPGVTKETTLLVVGEHDLWKLHGQTKSSKQRKAEQLIACGQALRILSENDFRRIALHILSPVQKPQQLNPRK